MAGIYLHIPFCKQACHYCNFHFSTSTALKDKFVAALLQEIELTKKYVDEGISTIYFGGGTPSILDLSDIALILQALHKNWAVDANAEITLEANPDDITIEKLTGWKSLGINRLSIGVQSFFEEDLVWMNRVHTAMQAEECIALATQAGFDNLTIDLIYGTPTLSDAHWKKNVDMAMGLNIAHLSCYALTVEPKTALEKLIANQTKPNINPETQARHFELLMQWTEEAGYEHYEISNFAKPGKRSRHNSAYWQGKSYLGLGPSAHSYNGYARRWNVSNNAVYIASLMKNELPYEEEILTKQQQMNEYVMTSLRTMEGINLSKIKEDFGEKLCDEMLQSAAKYMNSGNLIVEQNWIKTTPKGKLLADGIAAALFVL